MAQSVLEEVLSEQFGGVKVMTGKTFSENIRAFRLLLEGLLRPIVSNATVETIGNLK